MTSSADNPGARGSRPISADMIVADVIGGHPELVDIFVSFGFKRLLNPLLRRTVARHVTLEQACGMRDVDLERFLEALNSALEPEK